MENSSNALIMAGEILIAILVVSLFVYLVSLFGSFSKNMQEQMEISAVENFNNHFLDKAYRIDLTSNDVASAINFAREWNLEHGYALGGSLTSHDKDIYYVTVCINNNDVFDDTNPEVLLRFGYGEDKNTEYNNRINIFLNNYLNMCFSCTCKPNVMTDQELTNQGIERKEGKKYYKRGNYIKTDIEYNDKTGMIKKINFWKITNFSRQELTDVIIF